MLRAVWLTDWVRPSGRGIALTRIAVFLLAAIALAIGVTLWNLRQDALADASLNTDNLAIVLAEQTNRFVQAVDIVMHDVQEKIAALGVATPDDFRRILQREEMHEFLRRGLDRLPQVDNIALVGADGIRVNYSIGWPVTAVDMSDREYTTIFSRRMIVTFSSVSPSSAAQRDYGRSTWCGGSMDRRAKSSAGSGSRSLTHFPAIFNQSICRGANRSCCCGVMAQ